MRALPYAAAWVVVTAGLATAAAPPSPVPVSPSGTTVPPGSVFFVWDAVLGATSYSLWVNDAGGNTVVQSTVPDTAAPRYSFGSTLAVGSHTWWVRANNPDGNGPWSAATTFLVGCTAVVPPTLFWSMVDSSMSPLPIVWTWGVQGGVNGYRLSIEDSNGTTVFDKTQAIQPGQWIGWLDCSNLVGFCRTSVVPLPPGTYRAWVRAHNGCAVGPWSAPRSFTVVPGGCSAAPTTPTLIGPADELEVGNPVTVSWQMGTDLGQFPGCSVSLFDASGQNVEILSFRPADVCTGNTCTATLPATLPMGVYSWRVHVSTFCGSALSPMRRFTLSPTGGCSSPPPRPTTTAPVNGSTRQSPVALTWPDLASATSYRLWVSDAAENAVHTDWHLRADVCTGGSCSFSLPLMTGPHQWWVMAKNECDSSAWSQTGSFTVGGNGGGGGSCTAAPPKTLLGAPLDGAVVSTSPVVLSWPEITGSNAATDYFLWVNDAADTRVHGAWHPSSICTAGTCSVPVNLPTGTYRWWVQAKNTCGNSAWSEGRGFTIGWSSVCTAAPVAPALSSPGNGASAPSPVPFAWAEQAGANGATDYLLWVNNAADVNVHAEWHAAAATTCSAGTCTFPLPLMPGAGYQWWIKSKNACGTSAWSTGHGLTVTP
jgi:hypothetical protein